MEINCLIHLNVLKHGGGHTIAISFEQDAAAGVIPYLSDPFF